MDFLFSGSCNTARGLIYQSSFAALVQLANEGCDMCEGFVHLWEPENPGWEHTLQNGTDVGDLEADIITLRLCGSDEFALAQHAECRPAPAFEGRKAFRTQVELFTDDGSQISCRIDSLQEWFSNDLQKNQWQVLWQEYHI